MDAHFVITKYNSKNTAFLFEDGQLVRSRIQNDNSILGNIYTAKVANIVPSINAAFLDAGTGDYLYYSLIDNADNHYFLRHGNSSKVCIGDELLIQISKEPIKTKKGESSSNIQLKGRYLILNRSSEVGISQKIHDPEKRKTLKAGLEKYFKEYDDPTGLLHLGAIIRTSAENIEMDEMIKEASSLILRMKEIIERASHSVSKKCISESGNQIISDLSEILSKNKYEHLRIITDDNEVYTKLLEIADKKDVYFYDDKMLPLYKLYDIDNKLKKGLGRILYLKSGGNIVIEPTEALTVIDVNTAKAIKGKNVENNFLKINKEAAKEAARIMRLRNISGIIIIDFINMKEMNNIKELISYLEHELSKDETKVTYVDMTPLGLVELTRKKESKPLILSDFGL